jgi:hypothetical protein
MRRTESAVSFNVWTVQGTWFWSLVYPDRHGGAIGAAASEAEARGEAQAAIERFAQLGDEGKSALPPSDDPGFTRQFESSINSSFDICCEVDRAADAFSCSRISPKQSSKTQAMAESYRSLWQLTLEQFSARVAGASAAVPIFGSSTCETKECANGSQGNSRRLPFSHAVIGG